LADITAAGIVPVVHRESTASAAATAPGDAAACTNCNLRELCQLCCGLTRHERKIAERQLFTRRRVLCGESLYLTRDRFTSLYVVRRGFLKTTALLEKGREQVTGFSMTGEVLGMDGIEEGLHTCDTIALEDSDVCAFSFVRLQELTLVIPGLQRRFHAVMSREIVREHGMMLMLGSMHAEERVAMFLLDMSQRFAAQGGSASAFNLRLSRDEIGSYLGLTVGTISRIVIKFDDAGLIAARGNKFVRILDHAGLERLIGHTRR
jgi:CRP/FNR family transcriptional regulator